MVAKLDRLSRSMLDFAALMNAAQKQGWALVALDLGVDTSTPYGEMMANVLATFAQFERRLISQRTKEALAQKRAAGVQLHDQSRRIRILAGTAGDGRCCTGDSGSVDPAGNAVAGRVERSSTGAAAACACHAREEGGASPCAASNVAVRLDCTILQSGALRHERPTVRLYSSRYLATTG